MSGAFQEGMFVKFESFMIKPQKPSNTKPQGVSEADDALSGKLIQFYNFDEKQRESTTYTYTDEKMYNSQRTSMNIVGNLRTSVRINEHQRTSSPVAHFFA